MLTIRHLHSKADLDAYMELCVYCFSMPRDYRQVYGAFVEPHIDHSWGAFDNGRLIAAMWYIPFDMNVGKTYMPMGGVAAVATYPEARNSGLARTLITKAHRQMKDEGRPLAVLAPFKPEFYARMGYGDVFYIQECKIPPGLIANRPSGDYRIVGVDGQKGWKTFDRLHNQYSARYFGAVRRPRTYWQARYLKSAMGTRYHHLIVKGKTPVGFIITHLDKPYPAYSPDASRESHLSIVQAVWTDQGSFDAIMQFIRTHADQFANISWRLPTEVCVHDRLIDQRIDVKIRAKMMFKLVDIKGAIGGRPYDAALSGELTLRVKGDDTSPWNDGVWRIRWNRGEAAVSKITKPSRSQVVTTDIQTLSVLYSGHRSATRLAELGLLSGADSAIALLDRAFPRQQCYIEEWF